MQLPILPLALGLLAAVAAVATAQQPSWQVLKSAPGATGVGFLGGQVQALLYSSSGSLYAAGDFTSAPGGIRTSLIARVNTTTKMAYQLVGPAHPQRNPEGVELDSAGDPGVWCLKEFGGWIYAGGSFEFAGGLPASNLFRYQEGAFPAPQTGTFQGIGHNNDPSKGIVNTKSFRLAGVRALEVYQINGGAPVLIIGGTFDSCNGISGTDMVCSWDPATGSFAALPTTCPNLSNPNKIGVYALAVVGSDLYLGGRFLVVRGLPSRFIARFTGTDFEMVGGHHIDMETSRDGLAGAGSCSSCDERTAVLSMAEWNGKLAIGGFMTSRDGGTSIPMLILYDPASQAIDDFSASLQLNDAVHFLGKSLDGELLVGGDFYHPDRNIVHACRVSFDSGSNAYSFLPFSDGAWFDTRSARYCNYGGGYAFDSCRAHAIVNAGDAQKMWFGGSFDTLDVGWPPKQANGIAWLDTGGSSTSDRWGIIGVPGAGANDAVLAITPFGPNVIALGGAFSYAGDAFANRVAFFDTSTSTFSAVTYSGGFIRRYEVNALLSNADASRLFIGGNFDRTSGAPYEAGGLLEYDKSANSFNGLPVAGSSSDYGVKAGRVRAFAWYQNDLVIAGSFQQLGGSCYSNCVTANGLAIWSTTNRVLSPFSPADPGVDSVGLDSVNSNGDFEGPEALTVFNGLLFITGRFKRPLRLGGAAPTIVMPNVACWDGAARAWVPLPQGEFGPSNATISSILAGAAALFFSGSFATVAGSSSPQLAQLSIVNSQYVALPGLASSLDPFEPSRIFPSGISDLFFAAGYTSASDSIVLYNASTGTAASVLDCSAAPMTCSFVPTSLTLTGTQLFAGGYYFSSSTSVFHGVSADISSVMLPPSVTPTSSAEATVSSTPSESTSVESTASPEPSSSSSPSQSVSIGPTSSQTPAASTSPSPDTTLSPSASGSAVMSFSPSPVGSSLASPSVSSSVSPSVSSSASSSVSPQSARNVTIGGLGGSDGGAQAGAFNLTITATDNTGFGSLTTGTKVVVLGGGIVALIVIASILVFCIGFRFAVGFYLKIISIDVADSTLRVASAERALLLESEGALTSSAAGIIDMLSAAAMMLEEGEEDGDSLAPLYNSKLRFGSEKANINGPTLDRDARVSLNPLNPAANSLAIAPLAASALTREDKTESDAVGFKPVNGGGGGGGASRRIERRATAAPKVTVSDEALQIYKLSAIGESVSDLFESALTFAEKDEEGAPIPALSSVVEDGGPNDSAAEEPAANSEEQSQPQEEGRQESGSSGGRGGGKVKRVLTISEEELWNENDVAVSPVTAKAQSVNQSSPPQAKDKFSKAAIKLASQKRLNQRKADAIAQVAHVVPKKVVAKAVAAAVKAAHVTISKHNSWKMTANEGQKLEVWSPTKTAAEQKPAEGSASNNSNASGPQQQQSLPAPSPLLLDEPPMVPYHPPLPVDESGKPLADTSSILGSPQAMLGLVVERAAVHVQAVLETSLTEEQLEGLKTPACEASCLAFTASWYANSLRQDGKLPTAAQVPLAEQANFIRSSFEPAKPRPSFVGGRLGSLLPGKRDPRPSLVPTEAPAAAGGAVAPVDSATEAAPTSARKLGRRPSIAVRELALAIEERVKASVQAKEMSRQLSVMGLQSVGSTSPLKSPASFSVNRTLHTSASAGEGTLRSFSGGSNFVGSGGRAGQSRPARHSAFPVGPSSGGFVAPGWAVRTPLAGGSKKSFSQGLNDDLGLTEEVEEEGEDEEGSDELKPLAVVAVEGGSVPEPVTPVVIAESVSTPSTATFTSPQRVTRIQLDLGKKSSVRKVNIGGVEGGMKAAAKRASVVQQAGVHQSGVSPVDSESASRGRRVSRVVLETLVICSLEAQATCAAKAVQANLQAGDEETAGALQQGAFLALSTPSSDDSSSVSSSRDSPGSATSAISAGGFKANGPRRSVVPAFDKVGKRATMVSGAAIAASFASPLQAAGTAKRDTAADVENGGLKPAAGNAGADSAKAVTRLVAQLTRSLSSSVAILTQDVEEEARVRAWVLVTGGLFENPCCCLCLKLRGRYAGGFPEGDANVGLLGADAIPPTRTEEGSLVKRRGGFVGGGGARSGRKAGSPFTPLPGTPMLFASSRRLMTFSNKSNGLASPPPPMRKKKGVPLLSSEAMASPKASGGRNAANGLSSAALGGSGNLSLRQFNPGHYQQFNTLKMAGVSGKGMAEQGSGGAPTAATAMLLRGGFGGLALQALAKQKEKETSNAMPKRTNVFKVSTARALGLPSPSADSVSSPASLPPFSPALAPASSAFVAAAAAKSSPAASRLKAVKTPGGKYRPAAVATGAAPDAKDVADSATTGLGAGGPGVSMRRRQVLQSKPFDSAPSGVAQVVSNRDLGTVEEETTVAPSETAPAAASPAAAPRLSSVKKALPSAPLPAISPQELWSAPSPRLSTIGSPLASGGGGRASLHQGREDGWSPVSGSSDRTLLPARKSINPDDDSTPSVAAAEEDRGAGNKRKVLRQSASGHRLSDSSTAMARRRTITGASKGKTQKAAAATAGKAPGDMAAITVAAVDAARALTGPSVPGVAKRQSAFAPGFSRVAEEEDAGHTNEDDGWANEGSEAENE